VLTPKPENHGRHISVLYVIASLLAVIAATLAGWLYYVHLHTVGF
jgi:hypothetical protein